MSFDWANRRFRIIFRPEALQTLKEEKINRKTTHREFVPKGSRSPPGQAPVRLDGPLALARYLTSLIRRHRALDEQIRREARSSVGLSPGITGLKRMRLALKDGISAMSRGRLEQPG
jgi:uncharacterized protein YdcH (DUF465 family)